MDGTLSWPLDHAARLHADRVAAIDGARRLTYRELARRVGALGGALSRLGFERGAFVGVLAQNSLEHLECWLGLTAHGYVVNDLNYRLAVSELAFMIDDCGTRVLAVDAAHLDLARELRARCDTVRELIFLGGGSCPEDCRPYGALVDGPPAAPPELDGHTLAAISYTGGTTGRPKGVMLSHANLIANAKHNAIVAGYRADDVYLHAGPMFHIADTSQTFPLTWAGGTHVLLPRFDARYVLEAIAEHRVTIAVLVPTMLRMVLDVQAERPADLTSLRLVWYAAAPISPALQRRAMQTLSCDLLQGYGMTEAAPSVTFLTPEDHRRGAAGEEPYQRRLASVGTPTVGVQAEIHDGDGRPLAPAQVGEICVRGPNVMLGYWNRPESTGEVLAGGWYHTGDAGFADDDGYIYVVDRLKDMIVTGGENVYSIEVEQVLTTHPAVGEAAVFGVPDERWGERVHAIVVPVDEAPVSARDIIAHCRRHIAHYKAPRTVEIRLDALPRSGAGKTLKHELRSPYWAGHERRVSGA